MNERIVKLITKADTHAWSVADKYVASDCCNDGEVNYLWEDAFREKFAELIVKECIQSIENTIETNCDTDSEKIGCEFAITDLKEHFGVEE